MEEKGEDCGDNQKGDRKKSLGMSKHTEYKIQNIRIWNEIAPRYHRRWAGTETGPWRSSEKMIDLTGIKEGHRVLDVGCGTGALTGKIGCAVGSSGFVVGLDTSTAAIRIARRGNRQKNVDFVNGDAERFSFGEGFDVVACQYALFFFPDSQKALKNMAGSLRDGGTIGIAVHGNNTPYYSSITDVIARFIPDYLPAGSPRLDRFGTAPALRAELRRAGCCRISVREFVFSVSLPTFDDYWGRYRRYVSGQLREKLSGLSRRDQLAIRRQVRERTIPYTREDGRIVFPWQVLIATARRPRAPAAGGRRIRPGRSGQP